jgi:hypothetical protein
MKNMMTWKAWAIILSLIVLARFSIGLEVSDVSMDSEIYLNAGSSAAVFCNATINGSATAVSAILYNSYSSSNGAADNETDHYTNASCSNSMNSSICSFNVKYFANPSIWICNISATDGNFTASNWTNTTVQPLSAFSVTSITFHNYTANVIFPGTFSSEETMQLENTGNVNLTIEISAQTQSMSCGMGAIPMTNSHYSIAQGTPYNESVPLSTVPTLIQNFVLPKRTGPVRENVSMFWKLLVPTGVGGICEGGVYMSATG